MSEGGYDYDCDDDDYDCYYYYCYYYYVNDVNDLNGVNDAIVENDHDDFVVNVENVVNKLMMLTKKL